MKTILLILFSFSFLACSSKKVKSYPNYFEVKTKSFSNETVTIESIERSDVFCKSGGGKEELVKYCSAENGSTLFLKHEDAVKHANSLAKRACDGDISPVSAEVSREVAGKTPQECFGSGNSSSYGSSWKETCYGGEETFNRKVIMVFECNK